MRYPFFGMSLTPLFSQRGIKGGMPLADLLNAVCLQESILDSPSET